MKPYIGQTVHYKSYGSPGGEFPSEKRAAIVTAVHEAQGVSLCILNPNGVFFDFLVYKGSNAGMWNFIPEESQEGKA